MYWERLSVGIYGDGEVVRFESMRENHGTIDRNRHQSTRTAVPQATDRKIQIHILNIDVIITLNYFNPVLLGSSVECTAWNRNRRQTTNESKNKKTENKNKNSICRCMCDTSQRLDFGPECVS